MWSQLSQQNMAYGTCWRAKSKQRPVENLGYGLSGLSTRMPLFRDLSQPIQSRSRVMIDEHEIAVLTYDLPQHGLKAGDVGTIVLVHRRGEAYEVEFMTFNGK